LLDKDESDFVAVVHVMYLTIAGLFLGFESGQQTSLACIRKRCPFLQENQINATHVHELKEVVEWYDILDIQEMFFFIYNYFFILVY
jgi:hypothetical protein